MHEMLVQFFTPSPLLAPFIESYLVFEDDGGLKDLPLNIVPSGVPEIAVHYGDLCDSHLNYPGEGKGGYLYGPHNRPGYFLARGLIKCLCVLFKPYGAFRVFGYPQVEYRNHVVRLEDMCGMEGLNVVEQVTLAETIEEKVSAMDAFLTGQYKKAKERPVPIDQAMRIILYSKGVVRIHNLCRHLDVNIKTLERQFKSALGLTPKEFASIIRINHAYQLMNSDQKKQIGDIVFECGYYDQAHFINEFRHYTCCTPDVILKKPDDHVIYLNRMYTR